MTREERVQEYVETKTIESLRNFLQKVYASIGLPDPPIYTWSHEMTKEIVANVFLKAHPSGEFPWEK